MISLESDIDSAINCANFSVNSSTAKLRHAPTAKLSALLDLLEPGGIELRSLVIRSTSVRKKVWRRLGLMLQDHPRLESLTFHRLSRSEWHIIDALANVLEKNTVIKELRLSSGSYVNHKIPAMLDSIRHNPKSALVRFGLIGTNTNAFNDGNAATTCLARYLYEKNAKLEAVDLSMNRIGDSVSNMILRSLAGNRCLLELNLAWNNIGINGLDDFPEVLAANSTLRSLCLKNNFITNEGVSLITSGLARNATLQRLDLSCNPFDETGISELASGLKLNTGLRFLTLDGLHLDPSLNPALLALFHSGNHLHEVSLLQVWLEPQTVKDIISVLATERRGTKVRITAISANDVAEYVETIRKNWILDGASLDFSEDRQWLLMTGKDGQVMFELEYATM